MPELWQQSKNPLGNANHRRTHGHPEPSQLLPARLGTDLNEEVADAPEPVGDAGLVLPQPVVVRDADVVHILKEHVLLCKDQRIQAFGARLLHALQTEADVDGDFLGRRPVKEGTQSSQA